MWRDGTGAYQTKTDGFPFSSAAKEEYYCTLNPLSSLLVPLVEKCGRSRREGEIRGGEMLHDASGQVSRQSF
jgi:hypothetical protein